MSSFFQRGILHKISSTVEFLTFTVSFFIYIMTKDWLETIYINYLFCMLPSWMFSTNSSHNYQNLVTERTMCIKFYLLVHVHVHYQNYLKDIWKPVYVLCKLVNKCWNAEKGYLKRNHLCWLVVLSQCLWDF